MFRSIFDHPQGDFFSSLLQLLKIKLSGLLLRALPSLLDKGQHATTSTQSTTNITGMLPQTRQFYL